MQVKTSIEIAAPPEAVWDLMMQPARYSEFAEPADEMVDIGDGVVKKGYVYKERGGIPPFKSESTWTVTTFEPKTRQVHDGDDGKAKIRLDMQIAHAGSGSRLSQSIDLKPVWYLAPVMGLMWPLMMRKRAQEAMDKTSANVKRIVEAG